MSRFPRAKLRKGDELQTEASTVHTSPFSENGEKERTKLQDASPPQRRICAKFFQEPGKDAPCIHCRAKQSVLNEHVDAVRNSSVSLQGSVISPEIQYPVLLEQHPDTQEVTASNDVGEKDGPNCSCAVSTSSAPRNETYTRKPA